LTQKNNPVTSRQPLHFGDFSIGGRADLTKDQPNTFSVLLKAVAGGGATRIDRNLFTGSKLRQLGGAVFITTLTDNKGTILFTDVSTGFLGYSKLQSTGGTVHNDIAVDEISAPASRMTTKTKTSVTTGGR
jgi:hypothetical protein